MCGQSPVHDLVIDESLSLKQIYPMPAKENIDIKLNSDINQNVTIEFIDIMGRKQMLASDFEVNEGENVVNLNVEQFAPGTYQVIISANETVLRGSIIITE
jgi:hypothetical protein